MGLIQIEGMEFFAYHGCFKEEQLIGTHFKVDIALTTDTTIPEQSDNIKDAVNYQVIYAIIKKEMFQHSHLLEHVAWRIINALYGNFPNVKHIQVKVAKINPALAEGGKVQQVSVTVEQ